MILGFAILKYSSKVRKNNRKIWPYIITPVVSQSAMIDKEVQHNDSLTFFRIVKNWKCSSIFSKASFPAEPGSRDPILFPQVFKYLS